MEHMGWWLNFNTKIVRCKGCLKGERVFRKNAYILEGAEELEDEAVALQKAKEIIEEITDAVKTGDRKKIEKFCGYIGEEGDEVEFSEFRIELTYKTNLDVQVPSVAAKP